MVSRSAESEAQTVAWEKDGEARVQEKTRGSGVHAGKFLTKIHAVRSTEIFYRYRH